MKVIVAGFSKTGTKSMLAALLELDYKVYDFVDHYWYHGDDWSKIFTTGGSIEDFQRMYKDVDAVTDAPGFIFWEDISRAFPDCKIILTTRDEDSWHTSFKMQLQELKKNYAYQFMQVLSPTGWNFFKYQQKLLAVLYGLSITHPFIPGAGSEIQMRRVFRQHQKYCLQNAPKDRLLVYNISQGWKPLCNFLGVQIPNKPFPHENKSGKIFEKLMQNHPALLRMQREMMISLSFLLGLGVFGAYRFFSRGGGSYIMNVPNRLKSLFDIFVGKLKY